MFTHESRIPLWKKVKAFAWRAQKAKIWTEVYVDDLLCSDVGGPIPGAVVGLETPIDKVGETFFIVRRLVEDFEAPDFRVHLFIEGIPPFVVDHFSGVHQTPIMVDQPLLKVRRKGCIVIPLKHEYLAESA